MNRISIHNHGNVNLRGAQHLVCNTCVLQSRFQFCEIPFEMWSHKPRDRLIGDSQSLTGEKKRNACRAQNEAKNLARSEYCNYPSKTQTRIIHGCVSA